MVTTKKEIKYENKNVKARYYLISASNEVNALFEVID